MIIRYHHFVMGYFGRLAYRIIEAPIRDPGVTRGANYYLATPRSPAYPRPSLGDPLCFDVFTVGFACRFPAGFQDLAILGEDTIFFGLDAFLEAVCTDKRARLFRLRSGRGCAYSHSVTLHSGGPG